LLLSHGFIKKTQIDAINGNDVASSSYIAIIEGLNEMIMSEQPFFVTFNIPEREVKTVEVFIRGSILEHIQFVADQKGNNCIIKHFRNKSQKIHNALTKKCKLSKGYRIKQIKTTKFVNKKFEQITKYLNESAIDVRVQYLIIFEEGRLEWYGYDDNQQEKEPNKVEKQQYDLPKSPPSKNYAKSSDNIGISVIDADNTVTHKYGISKNTKFDDDDNSDQSRGSRDSLVIHSDDTEPEIDENEKVEEIIKEDVVIPLDDNNNDNNIIFGEDVKQQNEENDGNEMEEKKKRKKNNKKEITEDVKEENVVNENKESLQDKKVRKEREKKERLDRLKKIREEHQKQQELKEMAAKIKEHKKENKKEEKKKDNMLRKRFVAKIKNVCIAVPFDANESLLSFKKEIIQRMQNHNKLKKQKNLSKRIKFIKLKTPNFTTLIDCDPKDKLCDIATRKDMIVFHTESDDEEEENTYSVEQYVD